MNTELNDLKNSIQLSFKRAIDDPIQLARQILRYEKLRGVRQGSAYSKTTMHYAQHVTQVDIAAELGISVDTLQNMKKLLRLTPQLQLLITNGRINITTGFKVLARLTVIEQNELSRILPDTGSFKQKQIEKYIAEIRGKNKT